MRTKKIKAWVAMNELGEIKHDTCLHPMIYIQQTKPVVMKPGCRKPACGCGACKYEVRRCEIIVSIMGKK